MKKNKGFTLIELLAVIAILAILVIIALPNVMGMFNEAKENSFMTEVKTIYKLAQQKWISDSLFGTGDRTYVRCSSGTCPNQLDLSGRTEIEYYVTINQAGEVVEFDVTDGTYQYQYSGTGLNITDIKEADQIANITDDSQIINISCSGVSGGRPRPIEVCYVNDNISNVKRYDTVLSGTTVGELETRVYTLIDDGYINCVKQCGAVDYDCVYDCAMANRKENVSSSHVLLPKTEGCYTLSAFYYPCLSADCEIEVYDKKKKKRFRKKLRDITYDDLVLAWDFDLGEFVWAKPLWIQKLKTADNYFKLTFSDNTTLDVIGDHRIFSLDDNMFISAKEAPIGMNTINSDNKTITLINKELIEEKIEYSNIITNHHINVYADGILTSHGINNVYKINDMKFTKEERRVFSKDDFAVDEELFEGLRIGELDTLFSGSFDETKEDLTKYIDSLKNNKK